MSRADTPAPDVLVIGAGITGLCAALALADAGASVAILDAGLPAGSEANAGSLHVQLQSRFLRLFPDQAPNVEASLPLYLAAVRGWDALDRRLGGVEMVREGGLMVAEDAAQIAFLHEKAERETRHGLTVEILDRAALDDMAPYLGPAIVGAELCRDEGKINPLVANARLRKALAATGVQLRRGRARAVRVRPHAVEVETEATTLTADRVVLATAHATGALTAALGAVLPTAAESLHMNITEPADYAIRHLVQHAERPITLKQFQSGQIVIGGGWPARTGAGYDAPGVLEASLLGNVALAGQIAPGIRGLRLLRTWAGYNTTADGKSILGPLPGAERVILGVPGDAGYTLAPALGPAIAALALGTTPAFDTAPYAPDRFF